jgi:hypothetical protein
MDKIRPLAVSLQKNHMQKLGIANTMRIAKAYNRLKFGRYDEYRKAQYQNNFDALIRENGALTSPIIEMKDGWALDTSGSLPHLEQLLADAEEIIEELGGVRVKEPGAYRSFFQELPIDEYLERYPSIMDFALSSEVLTTVSNYLKCIPVMSSTLPRPIRFVESSAEYDEATEPHDSQLYHIDYYAKPMVYVIVLLRDVTMRNGPFCFLPRSVSEEAAETLDYWSRGRPYRFSDEEVHSVADKSEMIELSYPRGTVLFIESTGCFHYGSRNAVERRYQLMYGYTMACRTDFSEVFMKPHTYEPRDSDPRLRKMLLNKEFME